MSEGSGEGRLRHAGGLLLLWLGVGFVTGTAVLLGPLRWTADALRDAGAGAGTEAWAARGIMALFVVGSFFLARWMHRRIRRSSSLGHRFVLPATVAVLTAASVGMWLSPGLLSSEVLLRPEPEARFVLGPFPEEDDLRRLEESGFTAVVSLLHPAVVPFEPRLLEREREAARRVGLRFVHVPMLPWVGDNSDAVAKLRRLAREEGAHYYVHCYLGRDRVRMAERVARELGVAVRDAGSSEAPRRRLSDTLRLERGPVSEVAEGIFVGPYPTDEEYLGRVLATEVRSVVSLLDPSQPADTSWIRRERERVDPYPVAFRELPLARDPGTGRTREVADSLRSLPRPVYVHGFRSPSGRTEALVEALRTLRTPRTPRGGG